MISLLIPLSILLAYMTFLYVIALLAKNNALADVGYGIGFSILSVATVFNAPLASSGSLILVALVALWGSRLSLRIFTKNRGKPEDFRYKAWRDEWGDQFALRSFLQVFMLQGLIIFLVALPVTLALTHPNFLHSPLFTFGFLVWCVGFLLEAVGDYQLDAFITKSENTGKIMQSGLWKYTRHPNYFGESVMWWGIAVSASSITTLPLLCFVSPVLITYLLLRVSGVPLLEKRWEGRSDWETYKAKTPVFIPLIKEFK
ncbi:MAG: DUF1295 domain-containing protein [Patescibacteria group bacterium]